MARQPVTNPPVTFTPEALQQVIAQAIAEHEAAKAAKAKAYTSTEMERLTIKAFKRAGYEETRVLPRQNVLTYARWIEKGFKVKEGQKAVVVKSLRLFHADQVEKISNEEQAEYLAAAGTHRRQDCRQVASRQSASACHSRKARQGQGRARAYHFAR